MTEGDRRAGHAIDPEDVESDRRRGHVDDRIDRSDLVKMDGLEGDAVDPRLGATERLEDREGPRPDGGRETGALEEAVDLAVSAAVGVGVRVGMGVVGLVRMVVGVRRGRVAGRCARSALRGGGRRPGASGPRGARGASASRASLRRGDDDVDMARREPPAPHLVDDQLEVESERREPLEESGARQPDVEHRAHEHVPGGARESVEMEQAATHRLLTAD
jgi:hypothetical protein